MSKCDYYRFGECWGTRERDRCNCGGDESKCNFYPEKREKAKEEKPEYKLDFLNTLFALFELSMGEDLKKYEELYTLASELSELIQYIDLTVLRMDEMTIDDQLLMCRESVKYARMCKQIREKYGFEPEEENDNGEI